MRDLRCAISSNAIVGVSEFSQYPPYKYIKNTTFGINFKIIKYGLNFDSRNYKMEKQTVRNLLVSL